MNRWFGPRYSWKENRIPPAIHGSCGCCGCGHFSGEVAKDTVRYSGGGQVDPPYSQFPGNDDEDFDILETLNPIEQRNYQPVGRQLNLTLSGFPNEINWRETYGFQLFSSGSHFDYTLTGLGDLNGIYSQDLPRSQYGCFMPFPEENVRTIPTLSDSDWTFHNIHWLSSLITCPLTAVRTNYTYDGNCNRTETTSNPSIDLYCRVYCRIKRGVRDFGIKETKALLHIETGIIFSNWIRHLRPLVGGNSQRWINYPSVDSNDPNQLRFRKHNDTDGDIICESVGFTGDTIHDLLEGNFVWKPGLHTGSGSEPGDYWEPQVCGAPVVMTDLTDYPEIAGSYQIELTSNA